MIVKLVSFDTSIQKTGFCVFNNGEYKTSGTITPGKKVSGDDAFQLEAKAIIDFLNQELPDIIVIETTYQKNNFEVYRRLSMLVGVVYGWALEHETFISLLEAKKWRSCISSDFAKMKREDAKEWSKQYAENKYKISVQSDDESDAILIGQAQIEMFS